MDEKNKIGIFLRRISDIQLATLMVVCIDDMNLKCEKGLNFYQHWKFSSIHNDVLGSCGILFEIKEKNHKVECYHFSRETLKRNSVLCTIVMDQEQLVNSFLTFVNK